MTTFHSLKNDFLLDPEVIFLNHGSFGAAPRPVFETYQDWQRQLENQPVQFLEHQLPPFLAEARQALGDLVNASADKAKVTKPIYLRRLFTLTPEVETQFPTLIEG